MDAVVACNNIAAARVLETSTADVAVPGFSSVDVFFTKLVGAAGGPHDYCKALRARLIHIGVTEGPGGVLVRPVASADKLHSDFLENHSL